MSANVWVHRNPRTKNVEILELEQFNTLRINKKNFLNIVAIVGIARAGKSTLMNCLAGDNVFKTSNSYMPCTHGVWLSKSKTIGDNGAVVYADTEGEGNDCTDNDVKLLAPVLMLSKVVILNVPGKVLVGELLEKLELLVHIAKRIKNKKNDQFKFGHLIIAVRDFHYEDGTEKKVFNTYFAKEATTNNAAAVKRNAIRDVISSMFETVQVKLFRHSLETEQENHEANNLKNEINEMIRKPRIIEGTCLTIGNVGTFTKEFVDHLNKNKAFEVLTIVAMIQRKEIDEEYKRYKDLMLKIFDGLDHQRRGIVNFLTNQKSKLIQQFSKDTEKANSESQYRDDLKRDLEEFFSKRLAVIKETIKLKQRQLVDEEKAKFKKKLRNSFEDINLPVIKEDCLKERLIENKKSYFASFDRATGDVDLASEYKRSAREDLQSFTSEEINKMLEKNRDRKRLIKKLIKGGLGVALGVVVAVGAVVTGPAVMAGAAAAAATAGTEAAAAIPTGVGIAGTLLAGAAALFRNVRP